MKKHNNSRQTLYVTVLEVITVVTLAVVLVASIAVYRNREIARKRVAQAIDDLGLAVEEFTTNKTQDNYVAVLVAVANAKTAIDVLPPSPPNIARSWDSFREFLDETETRIKDAWLIWSKPIEEIVTEGHTIAAGEPYRVNPPAIKGWVNPPVTVYHKTRDGETIAVERRAVTTGEPYTFHSPSVN